MTDNDLQIEQLVNILPPKISTWISQQSFDKLTEIVLDFGQPVELRYLDGFIINENIEVSLTDIKHILSNPQIGKRTTRNRCSLEGTLHRISCIEDRDSNVVGLTLRIGRDFSGLISVVQDLVDSGENILFLGKPGVGKTSKLREVARYLSTELNKRVIVVDSSNEIAGEGSRPHPAVGRARRMMVPGHKQQFEIMLEALENHTPQVIIIDEISHIREAQAAQTIAERGVQLFATAHGNSLENVLNNAPLKPLVGTIKDQTMGDDYFRRTGQKSRLERIMPPTFTKVVELINFDEVAIHHDVASATDCMLTGGEVVPEIRRMVDGKCIVIQQPRIKNVVLLEEETGLHNFVIKDKNIQKTNPKGRKRA